MSGQVRTVRLLRDPGEASETRTVAGVTVEKGIPFKSYQNGLQRVLAALLPGESFVWHTYPSFNRDHHEGKKFQSQKIGVKQYRVWRTK